MPKLKSFRLLNIQSWGDDSEIVEFDSELLNVIIGRNETGKSVLFKVLAQMFNPDMYGMDAHDLVRDGASEGMALFTLTSGESVIYRINTNNRYVYYFLDKQGKLDKSRSFSGPGAPSWLTEVFGWLVDYREGVILNLLHKDGSNLPFITTSKRFNAAYLRFITSNPQLDKLYEVFQHNLALLNQGIKNMHVRIGEVAIRYNALEYTNISSLTLKKEHMQELQGIWACFNQVLQSFYSLNEEFNVFGKITPRFTLTRNRELMDSIPQVIKSYTELRELNKALQNQIKPHDFEYITTLYSGAEIWPSSYTTLQILESLQNVVQNYIVQSDYSYINSLQELAIVHNSGQGLLGVFKELGDILDSKAIVQDYGYMPKLRMCAEMDYPSKTMYKLLYALYSILKEKPEHSNLPVKSLELYADIQKSGDGILHMLYDQLYALVNLSKSVKAANETDATVRTLENELGVCPTCGRIFGDS